jgi:hypothetical protein
VIEPAEIFKNAFAPFTGSPTRTGDGVMAITRAAVFFSFFQPLGDGKKWKRKNPERVSAFGVFAPGSIVRVRCVELAGVVSSKLHGGLSFAFATRANRSSPTGLPAASGPALSRPFRRMRRAQGEIEFPPVRPRRVSAPHEI